MDEIARPAFTASPERTHLKSPSSSHPATATMAADRNGELRDGGDSSVRGGGGSVDDISTPVGGRAGTRKGSASIAVRKAAGVVLLLEPNNARILQASEGALASLGHSKAELREKTLCDMADGLTLVEWSKAMAGLSSQEARRVVLR